MKSDEVTSSSNGLLKVQGHFTKKNTPVNTQLEFHGDIGLILAVIIIIDVIMILILSKYYEE